MNPKKEFQYLGLNPSKYFTSISVLCILGWILWLVKNFCSNVWNVFNKTGSTFPQKSCQCSLWCSWRFCCSWRSIDLQMQSTNRRTPTSQQGKKSWLCFFLACFCQEMLPLSVAGAERKSKASTSSLKPSTWIIVSSISCCSQPIKMRDAMNIKQPKRRYHVVTVAKTRVTFMTFFFFFDSLSGFGCRGCDPTSSHSSSFRNFSPFSRNFPSRWHLWQPATRIPDTPSNTSNPKFLTQRDTIWRDNNKIKIENWTEVPNWMKCFQFHFSCRLALLDAQWSRTSSLGPVCAKFLSSSDFVWQDALLVVNTTPLVNWRSSSRWTSAKLLFLYFADRGSGKDQSQTPTPPQLMYHPPPGAYPS